MEAGGQFVLSDLASESEKFGPKDANDKAPLVTRGSVCSDGILQALA